MAVTADTVLRVAHSPGASNLTCQAPDPTTGGLWTYGPRGWIAATLLALVAVVLLLRPW